MNDILTTELATLRERQQYASLDILETGCIRSSDAVWETSDGWSTLTFARHNAEHGGSTTYIDLNTASAAEVLEKHGLSHYAALHSGHSVTELRRLAAQGRTYDLILLDSADDPALIFEEYQVAVPMVRTGGMVIVDDCKIHDDSPGMKGEHVLAHLDASGIGYRSDRRQCDGVFPGVYLIDVVMIDAPR